MGGRGAMLVSCSFGTVRRITAQRANVAQFLAFAGRMADADDIVCCSKAIVHPQHWASCRRNVQGGEQ